MNRRGTAVIIVTGAGGVGKTTISAALAIAAAAADKRTLVVTVDPARRLADALGLPDIGNQPTRVLGIPGLWAAMLDVTASWEAIAHRHAAPDVAARLQANPFFRAIADRFPAAQSYAAGEQMAEYVDSQGWDVIVIDTPPAAGGLDFFFAPRRMRDLVGGRLLKILTGAGVPGRRTLYRVTARPVLRLTDTILGSPLLEEIAEFLLDLRSLYDGLAARARDIERLMADAKVLVVTTAEPTPLREARRFFDELPEAAILPDAVVFNRDLPDDWIETARLPAPSWPHGARLHDNLRQWAFEARRMADARSELAARYPTDLVRVPWLAAPPNSVAALRELVSSAPGLGVETLLGDGP